MTGPKVRIVSEGGAGYKTKVFVDDVQLLNVVNIEWRAAGDGMTCATLELVDVEADVVVTTTRTYEHTDSERRYSA